MGIHMSQQSFVTDFLNTDADLDWHGFQRGKAHAQSPAFGLESLDPSAFTDLGQGVDSQGLDPVLAGPREPSGALDSAAGLAPEPHVAADGEAAAAASPAAPLDVALPSVPVIGKLVVDDVGNHIFLGGDTSETYIDLGGDDLFLGKGGNDYIYAGPGYDYAGGGDGNDRLYGDYQVSAGLLSATGGNDTLYGGAGNDYLWGGPGGDNLYGEADDDTLVGGDGADTIEGGKGNDSLTGGAGPDRFVFTGALWGHDVITDFQPGVDKLVQQQAPDPIPDGGNYYQAYTTPVDNGVLVTWVGYSVGDTSDDSTVLLLGVQNFTLKGNLEAV
jgi:Ca2+-binding RTX toxin-like protein